MRPDEEQPDQAPRAGEPARSRRPRGLSLRATVLLATAFGLMVVGSAYLKHRHLRDIAGRVQWTSADFDMGRPGFDRPGFEADPTVAQRRRRAHALFLEAMAAHVRGDDSHAQSRLLQAAQQEPEWPIVRFYLGFSRLSLGFPLAAVDDLEAARAAGFDPPEGPCDWWLGLAKLYAGHTEEGARTLRSVATSSAPQAAMARDILERLEAENRDGND